MKRDIEFKQTVGYGKTKVTTLLPLNHPVYKGVMTAKKMLGGSFPDHVGHIFIRPECIKGPRDFQVVCGECSDFSDISRGSSKIDIYAGSIEASTAWYSVESEATEITLHEFGHSSRLQEIQVGAWLGITPGRRWEEEDADTFALQTIRNYWAGERQKRPRLTMRQLLEQRRSQKK